MLFSGPVFREMFTEIQQDVGCRNSNRKYGKHRRTGIDSGLRR